MEYGGVIALYTPVPSSASQKGDVCSVGHIVKLVK